MAERLYYWSWILIILVAVDMALILELWLLYGAGLLPVASKAWRTWITSYYGKENPIVKLNGLALFPLILRYATIASTGQSLLNDQPNSDSLSEWVNNATFYDFIFTRTRLGNKWLSGAMSCSDRWTPAPKSFPDRVAVDSAAEMLEHLVCQHWHKKNINDFQTEGMDQLPESCKFQVLCLLSADVQEASVELASPFLK